MIENTRIVLISSPQDAANKLAREIVENRLGACVNIFPKVESYYWWDNAVQHDTESQLIVKTSAGKLEALLEFIEKNHPYELPEVISFEPTDGSAAFAAWINKETEGE